MSNLLKEKYPEIFSQINIEKTLEKYPDLNIDNLTCGSGLKIFWNCDKCKYSYEQIICNKILHHQGCPYCSNKKAMKGLNDLETLFPDIAKEFASDLNGITPDKVVASSAKKYYWRCKNNPDHIWKTEVRLRTKHRYNCPICNNQKLMTGVNDLQTKFPDIAKEFASDLNGITPDNIIYGSGKKYYWRCCKNPNHIWITDVYSRTSKDHTGCPFCVNRHSTPELLFHEIVKKYVDKDSINSYNYFNKQFDEYIPILDCFVEYDGNYFHSDGETTSEDKEILKNREIKKNLLILQNNKVLYRIRETHNINKANMLKEKINGITYYYICTLHGYNNEYFIKYSEILHDMFSISIDPKEIKKVYLTLKRGK